MLFKHMYASLSLYASMFYVIIILCDTMSCNPLGVKYKPN